MNLWINYDVLIGLIIIIIIIFSSIPISYRCEKQSWVSDRGETIDKPEPKVQSQVKS